MARVSVSRHVCVLLCCLFLLGAQAVYAQVTKALATPQKAGTFDATNLREPADLGGIWLVKGGDDPAYARADFDDSGWTPFDTSKSVKPLFPGGNPGVIWYRLHIKVARDQTGLALAESSISHAFCVYANGVKLIEEGQISPYVSYETYGTVFARVPDDQVATGSIVIALRVHNDGGEWAQTSPGYYSTNLRIGEVAALQNQFWLVFVGSDATNLLRAFVLICLSITALLLYSAQRGQPEYLWLFIYGVVSTAMTVLALLFEFRLYPLSWETLTTAPVYVGTMWCLTLTYFAFVHQRIHWVAWIYLGTISLFVFSMYLDLWPETFTIFRSIASWIAPLLVSALIATVLLVHWRRGNREAGILLIPLVLGSVQSGLAAVLTGLSQLPASQDWALRLRSHVQGVQAGPIWIYTVPFFDMLSLLALALIILLRTNRISRQGAELEGEMAAARQVQQVMLPEQIEAIPGFAIESVYLPAKQVGGDFFQILSVPTGGMLVVVGDVAGKGLPAAMLVSVLVGATRTAADYGHAPEEVLARLNERLVGRASGGFSTALAAYIDPNGRVTIANAGHLSPYLDGVEVDLPGALPLGIVSGATYETRQIDLTPGSRLTFYSDGVVEAQDAKGQLLGFARGQELSTQPAAVIVEAARSFGQSDDITVVAITRDAVASNAAANAPLEPVMI